MSWNLAITPEEFDEFYPMMIDYKWIFERDFKTDAEFLNDYFPSKLWRLNNVYTIVDKEGEAIPFKMNRAQHKVYSALLKHPRLIILKSRQQGISTFWLVSFFDDSLTINNLNVGLMSQGADESATLLERVKFSWEAVPNSVKSYLQVTNDKDNAKAFSFSNGSTIFIRTSFRSATLQRMHISELGKIANKYPQKAKETNTGTLQTIKPGLPVVIESTAEGDNMFKKKWDKAYHHTGPLAGKDFLAVFLSWLDDPDCVSSVDEYIPPDIEDYFEELEAIAGRRITKEQRNFWVMQKRELDDSGKDTDIFQEYPATPEEAFAANSEGKYYIKSYNKHIRAKKRVQPDLFDENLAVDVVMDLGMNDDFVLGFWQYDGKFERLVHEYRNHGEGLDHYVNYMFKWCADHNTRIDNTVCPHDIKVRDLSAVGGITRKQRLRELGVRRIRVVDKTRILTGIEAVRVMIPKLWIDKSCEYVDGCIRNYSKEWDEKLQVWKDKPLHDDWSHGADMVRMRAMSKPQYRKKHDVPKGGNKKQSRSTGVVDGVCL